VEELNISKSSASNALKNLEIRGDIEYLTLPGDRKRYFRFRRRNLLSIIETFQQKTASFKHITNHILELKEDKNSLNSRYLKQLMEMIDFFSAKLNDTKAEFTKMMEANSQENNQK
jgi:DNA-binding transcriptional regulator GbsR (MarR family)